MVTLYLAGPITGRADYRTLFYDAETRLRFAGYRTLNPANHAPLRRPGADADDQITHADWMRPALVALTNADGVALLPGWEASKGALWEARIAREVLKLPVKNLTTWLHESEDTCTTTEKN